MAKLFIQNEYFLKLTRVIDGNNVVTYMMLGSNYNDARKQL